MEKEEEKDCDITLLKASAGSGKTYKLAYRFIRKILTSPEFFDEVLAVTFTNKATCQMKEKILDNLQELRLNPEKADYTKDLCEDLKITDHKTLKKMASKAQLEILSDYDRFSVSTIDKFFSKVVRNFFNELKKDPNYKVVTSNIELIDKAINQIIVDGNNKELLEPLFRQRITEDRKNSDIRQNIKAINKIILKLHNEIYNLKGLREKIDNDKKTAKDLKPKIAPHAKQIIDYLMTATNLTVDDFPQKNSSFAANLVKIASGDFSLKAQIKKVANGTATPYNKTSPHKDIIEGLSERLVEDLKNLVEQIEEYDTITNTTELIETNINLLEVIAVVYKKYIDNCQAENVIAISEMPALVKTIAENSSLIYLYMKIGTLLHTIMIDEFQDTSDEQWEGFLPILDEIRSSIDSPYNLIIGDIKQAIYRWRNGDEELLRCKVAKQFNVYRDVLKQNFRSREAIVKFNNALYDAVAQTKLNGLIEYNGIDDIADELSDRISQTYSESSQSLGNEDKQTGGYVECISVLRNDIPAKVVETIKNILDLGYRYSDIAIIIRDNNDAAEIAQILVTENIPFISGESLLLTNALIVKKMVALMHIATDTSDTIAIAAYNNLSSEEGPSTEMSPADLDNLHRASTMSLIEAAAFIQQSFNLCVGDELAYFDAFMDKIYSKYHDETMSVADFVKWWDDSGKDTKLSSSEGQNAVDIVTIHKSKGLEYPVVIAPYVDWKFTPKSSNVCFKADEGSGYEDFGTMPIKYSEKLYYSHFRKSYLEETLLSVVDNINLLYVLTTRPKDQLYLFCPITINTSKNKTTMALAKNSIYKIIKSNFEKINADLSGLKPVNIQNSDYFKFTVGTPEKVTPKNDTRQHIEISDITVKDFDNGLAGSEITPDMYRGIAMHKALSSITSLDELAAMAEKVAKREGIGYDEIEPMVKKVLARPEMHDWFNSKWKVYSERAILIPNQKTFRRPDRVLVSDDTAIVIDYKFGNRYDDRYLDQVREYMSLLSMIGYKKVYGHIYYVMMDRIIDVE